MAGLEDVAIRSMYLNLNSPVSAPCFLLHGPSPIGAGVIFVATTASCLQMSATSEALRIVVSIWPLFCDHSS